MSPAARRLYVRLHRTELAASVPQRLSSFPFWFLLASRLHDRQLTRARRQGLRTWEARLAELAPRRAAGCRLLLERWLGTRGHTVVGLDEAGRGALAGPLVAAAVVLPPGRISRELWDLDDSKRLEAGSRRRLYRQLVEGGAWLGLGRASPREIDRFGIQAATGRAMERAVTHLLARASRGDRGPVNPYLLVDGFPLPASPLPQCSVIKGERLSLSIAAASVAAKVVRDRCMERLAGAYAAYGLDQHKGYGTPEHRAALRRYGPSPLHRQTFLTRASPDGRAATEPEAAELEDGHARST